MYVVFLGEYLLIVMFGIVMMFEVLCVDGCFMGGLIVLGWVLMMCVFGMYIV